MPSDAALECDVFAVGRPRGPSQIDVSDRAETGPGPVDREPVVVLAVRDVRCELAGAQRPRGPFTRVLQRPQASTVGTHLVQVAVAGERDVRAVGRPAWLTVARAVV